MRGQASRELRKKLAQTSTEDNDGGRRQEAARKAEDNREPESEDAENDRQAEQGKMPASATRIVPD